MKKSIVALSLVLALVMAGPVAAAGIDFGGAIETKIEVNRNNDKFTVNPESELSLNLGVSDTQDKLRAGVEFGLTEESKELMPSGISLADVTLKEAFIEADGPYWHGGPEATTRFGTLDIGYSPYATLKDRSGISISGLDLDVVGLNGFYGLPAGEQGHVVGMRADLGLIEDVELGASVIADSEIIRLQADAAVSPMEGLNVSGVVAVDHDDLEGLNNLWTVKAGYELMENTNVEAGYKYISDGWDPEYVGEHSEEDEDDLPQDWLYDRKQNHGMFVGLSTAQQGVNINANYDQVLHHAKVAADTEYEGFRFDVETILDVPSFADMSTNSTSFGVERDIDVMEGLAVTASYNGEWIPADSTLTHTLGASTILGLFPAIDGLALNGEVSASEFNWDSIGYKVGAEFSAPNGVNLGIEHDRTEGTTFEAGMKVEF